MKPITPNDLADMGALAFRYSFRIDLVYADAGHPENIFGTALYRRDAPFLLHKLFAPVVIDAAQTLQDRYGARLVLKDGLRPVEAQAAMQETAIVRANPQWCEGPDRLLSKPGQGGHPRGMAVDVAVEGPDGQPWDMGTVFDTMTPSSARSHADFSQDILDNRARLEQIFLDSAARRDLPLLPLPSEWWDFRFPAAFSEHYAPVSDADLPTGMQMTAQS